jgi:hypothetical protein
LPRIPDGASKDLTTVEYAHARERSREAGQPRREAHLRRLPAVPDDGQRPELIDSWLEIHQVGRVFYAPYDVVFSNFDVVEPDLLYLSSEADDSLTTPLLPGLEMPLRRIFRE